jgi:tetratricopeptide (TPR) repeat protein
LPWLDKALKIDPHHVNSLWNKGILFLYLGECLRMLKQRDDARVWFDKALEINPMHA